MTRPRAAAWTLINTLSGVIWGRILLRALATDGLAAEVVFLVAVGMFAIVAWGVVDCAVKTWRGPS